jgi:tRNA(fMet)-specific endonuclease VapC
MSSARQLTHLLDSDIVSLYQQGDPIVVENVLNQPFGNIGITVITVEEQLSGWYTLIRRAKDHARLARAYHRLASAVEFLGRFAIAPFDEPAIERFEELRSRKLGIAGMDLRIAAIALEQSCNLVTRNTRDFRSVPGLVIEDWSKSRT